MMHVQQIGMSFTLKRRDVDPEPRGEHLSYRVQSELSHSCNAQVWVSHKIDAMRRDEKKGRRRRGAATHQTSDTLGDGAFRNKSTDVYSKNSSDQRRPTLDRCFLDCSNLQLCVCKTTASSSTL